MRTSLYSELTRQVSLIVRNHINNLNQYTTLVSTIENEEPQEIVLCLERLANIADVSPEICSAATYEEITQCMSTVEMFLKTMQQPKDSAFSQTYIGRVCAQAYLWCCIASRNFGFSIETVWKLLEPAVPDSLSEVQKGLYEARWWKPVPLMDVEILKHTEGVIIYGEPFAPLDLPKGLAVQFSVVMGNQETQPE